MQNKTILFLHNSMEVMIQNKICVPSSSIVSAIMLKNIGFVLVVLCIGQTTSLHFRTNCERRGWHTSMSCSLSDTSSAPGQHWSGRPGVNLEDAWRTHKLRKFIEFSVFAWFGRKGVEGGSTCFTTAANFFIAGHCRMTSFITGATFFTTGGNSFSLGATCLITGTSFFITSATLFTGATCFNMGANFLTHEQLPFWLEQCSVLYNIPEHLSLAQEHLFWLQEQLSSLQEQLSSLWWQVSSPQEQRSLHITGTTFLTIKEQHSYYGCNPLEQLFDYFSNFPDYRTLFFTTGWTFFTKGSVFHKCIKGATALTTGATSFISGASSYR